jgi:hypothetical protein
MPLPEWAPSARINDSRISFLDLALELREQIYEEVLVLSEIRQPTDAAVEEWKLNFSNMAIRRLAQAKAEKVIKPNLRILRVCRQTRAEASNVFLSRNTFATRDALKGFLRNYPQDNMSEIQKTNEEIIKKAVRPSYMEHVTQLKFKVFCNQESVIYGYRNTHIQPWTGDFGEFIEKTSPAMKKATFVLDHFDNTWLRLFAIQQGVKLAPEPPELLTSDDEEYGDTIHADYFSDDTSDWSDDTDDLNDHMIGMGLTLFGDTDAPLASDLGTWDSDDDSDSDSSEDDPDVMEPTNVEDAPEPSHDSNQASSSSSDSEDSLHPQGINGMALSSMLGMAESFYSNMGSDEDSDNDSLMDFDPFASAFVFSLHEKARNAANTESRLVDTRARAIKDVTEEQRAGIHKSVLEYWKKELGFDKGIPGWAEFEFLPRHLDTGNYTYLEVDMQDIWNELKAERDTLEKK